MKSKSVTINLLRNRIVALNHNVRRLREELNYKDSNITLLGQLLANMRISLRTKDVLFVLLTGITAEPGLGFNRASIFLLDDEERFLSGRMAISPNSFAQMKQIYESAARQKYDFSFYISQYYQQNLIIKNVLNKKICAIRIPLEGDDNLIVRAFLKKEAFHVKNPENEQKSLPTELRKILTKPFVAAPVMIDGSCNGVIIADNYYTDSEITDRKVQSLQDIASFSSTMIENALRFEKAELQSTTDELTKLHNYRYFRKRLAEEIKRANRYRRRFSLTFLDLDHFKHFNDNFGHLAGNKVLMDIAKIIKESIRSVDLAARYGGDEFVIILPETNPRGARIAIEKLREKIESYSFAGDGISKKDKLAVSGGIACFPEDGKSDEDLIAKADKRLYTAKAQGRNKIVS